MQKIDKKMLIAGWSCNNKYWVIYQAYHFPLREMFKEVVNFDPQEETYKHGKKIMNEKFINILKKEKPDYIMLFLVWDEFYPETLVKIKEILPNSKVFQWNGDDDIKFDNYTIPYSAVIDYQFISQLHFTKKYDNYDLPWFDVLGADIEKFKHIPSLKKKYGVAFVGTPKGERLEYMRYLLKNKVDFVLAGGGWKEYPEFKDRYLGQLSDEDFVKLINQTKINICFSKNYFSSPHLLERSLQVNACKSFALTGYVDGYFEKFTEGVDFASFKTKEELLEKIKYYLKHEKEREKIGTNAYNKVINKYSNQKLFWNAFKVMKNDKRELHSITALKKYLALKPVYLTKADFRKGKEHITIKVGDAKYIAFKQKGYFTLKHRDYFQIYTMDLLKKPVSVCDLYLNSKLIGDYACLALFYANKYHYDKEALYENINPAQIIVEKEFFFKNLAKFANLYNGSKPLFLNEKNNIFITMPLVRTRKIKKIPLKNIEHIFSLYSELNLMVLRNQKKLLRNLYIYKLILYSVLINPQVLKHLLVNVLRKTKNAHLTKVSNFFNKVF